MLHSIYMYIHAGANVQVCKRMLHLRRSVHTWAMKQSLSSFQCLKINLHVLRTCFFHRISPIAEDHVKYGSEYEIHRMSSVSTISICKQKIHYFTCQKTDFHSLGDILMWFKSGVGVCLVCGTTESI